MKTQNENQMADDSSNCRQRANLAWQAVACLLLLLASLHLVQAETYVGGAVSGTWTTNGSPYIVRSNAVVDSAAQLIIEPGVTVRFETNTGLTVYGTLNAEGADANRIVFTSNEPAPGSWYGIYLSASGSYTSWTLRYCIVEYGMYGIFAEVYPIRTDCRGNLQVEDTLVHSCSMYGVLLNGHGSTLYTHTSGSLNVMLTRCQVVSNSLFGIRCFAVDGGMGSYGEVTGAIENSTVYHNGGNGIEFQSSTNRSTPNIGNSVVFGNGGAGIKLDALRQDCRNNIVVSNGLGITAARIEGSPPLAFNTVWGNGTNWAGVATSQESAPGNVSADPLFADPAAGDFHLRSQAGRYDPVTGTWIRDQVTSPCIDAGDPASAFASEPEPNGARINMGAFGGTPFASKGLPRLTGVLDAATRNLALSWGCLPNETYQVLYGATPSGPWLDDLPGSQRTAGASQTTLTYTNASVSAQTNRFYRVRWNTP